MVVLRIKSLELDPGVKHIATDWEISDTQNFKHIVARSLEDRINVSSIMFDVTLDPEKKYWARARALLDGRGYTIWGNLDIFVVKTYNDFENTTDLPTPISAPVLKTSSDVRMHEPTLFTLTATGFSIYGNAKHVATSWFIEDLDGQVVWSRIYDTIHKESIIASSVLLENARIYRAKAVFHASSNDVSPIATTSFVTAPYVYDNIGQTFLRGLKELNFTVDNTITFPPVEWAFRYDVKITEVVNDDVTLVAHFQDVDADCKIKLKANTLIPNRTYVFNIVPNIGDPVIYYLYNYYPSDPAQRRADSRINNDYQA